MAKKLEKGCYSLIAFIVTKNIKSFIPHGTMIDSFQNLAAIPSRDMAYQVYLTHQKSPCVNQTKQMVLVKHVVISKKDFGHDNNQTNRKKKIVGNYSTNIPNVNVVGGNAGIKS